MKNQMFTGAYGAIGARKADQIALAGAAVGIGNVFSSFKSHRRNLTLQ